MRGQAYTITNMLVWAVFAVVFLVAVYSAYNFLSSYTPPTYIRQIKSALASAWKARYTNATPVVVDRVQIPGGTVFEEDAVKKWVGARDVCFTVGPGFEKKNGSVVAKTTITARVLVCCENDRCWIGFNVPPVPGSCVPC